MLFCTFVYTSFLFVLCVCVLVFVMVTQIFELVVLVFRPPESVVCNVLKFCQDLVLQLQIVVGSGKCMCVLFFIIVEDVGVCIVFKTFLLSCVFVNVGPCVHYVFFPYPVAASKHTEVLLLRRACPSKSCFAFFV